MTPSDIGELSGASAQGINNWQRRFEDFPDPSHYDGRTPLFEREATLEWLSRNGKLLGSSPDASRLLKDVALVLRQSISDVPKDQIFSEVIAPALDQDSPTDLGSVIRGATAEVGGEHVADILVDLIGRLPSHIGTEFSVPTEMRRLVSEIARAHRGTIAYDGCGGAGTMLAAVTPEHGESFLQEIDHGAAALAQGFMKLRKQRTTIRVGDTISKDEFPDVLADVVFMSPPLLTDIDNIDPNDRRWEYGIPKPTDHASIWTQIAVAHMASDGLAILHFPTRELEAQPEGIFERLLQRNLVDMIIEVGPGQIASPIRTKGSCLVVLNGNRPRTLREHTPIVMCDLTAVREQKGRYSLTPDIVDTFVNDVLRPWRTDRQLPPTHFATTVTVPELRERSFDLQPSRFINSLDWPRAFDNTEVPQHPAERDLALKNQFVANLTITHKTTVPPALTQAPRSQMVTIRELRRRGILNILRPVSPRKAASRTSPHEDRSLSGETITPGDLSNNVLQQVTPEPRIEVNDLVTSVGGPFTAVRKGDILIPMQWMTGKEPFAAIATEQQHGHILGMGLVALRLKLEFQDLLDLRYLQWWLATPAFTHFMTKSASQGSSLNRVMTNDLQAFAIPLSPISFQHQIVRLLDESLGVVQAKRDAHQRAVDTYNDMEDLLIELFGASHLVNKGDQ